jgi:hypothetical protein
MITAIESRGAILAVIEKLAEVNATLQASLIAVATMVDDAVQALQFEDMVVQLLVDSVQRLRQLESMADVLFEAAIPLGGAVQAARLSRELQGLESRSEPFGTDRGQI